MPSVDFPFRSFRHSHLGVLYRPHATIELQHANRIIRGPFLVDSGADTSVIGYKVGLALGLQLEIDEPLDKLGGAASGIPVVYRMVQMRIGPYQVESRMAWAIGYQVKSILGRLDVFDHFNIDFRQSERRTIFKPTARV